MVLLMPSTAAVKAESGMMAVPAAVDKRNCTCRFAGKKFGLGKVLCLKTPKGSRMARCELNLNNTSWKILSTPCNLVSRPVRWAALDF
jgi:hypothetical protein